jgi:hypothetical protein
LGKWKHPDEVESAEDILADPSSIPYSAEVNKALTPARKILGNILTSPNEDPGEYVHAKAWLEDQGKEVDDIIPYVGTLSVIERAQIANWFETHVSLTKEARVLWMTRLPIAHAHTIFIAFRIRKDPCYKTLTIPDLFLKAWEAQLTGVPTILKNVDVDRECVEFLEEEMFENTDRTGASGNEQWGLDVGHHQGGWNPYIDAPKLWDGKKREGDESELEVRLTRN